MMADFARWAEAETLFLEALDRPPSERAAYLVRACGDPTLRSLVERLLADAEAGADFFLDRDARNLAVGLLTEGAGDPAGPDVAGRLIGPYRLVRLLGRGGMGSVFLAEREGDGFRQRVALKLLPHYLPTEDLVHRFRRERALLAGLDHPGIARFIDGGKTDDGALYFVMEYVDGEPITAYCDRRGLSLDARLVLFEQVCEAVQHAHQRLIVHRDLKPGNIFVTDVDGSAQVKLLDFGIAKLLDEEQTAEASVLTRDGALPLTPQYAAPEQFRREEVTTATDVYALGVLLYELLTGRRPSGDVSLRQGSPAGFGDEPVRPSAVLAEAAKHPEAAAALRTRYQRGADQLRRALSGDLDVVCLKALRQDPARRYASAAQFAQDIRACRAGFPVSARPESVGYRLRAFARRHRAGVTTALLVLVLAIGSVAFYTHRITQERNRVQLEARKTEAVKNFLVHLLASSDPGQALGDSVLVRDVLERGAAQVRAELTSQPEVQAELFYTIGSVYLSLGQYDRADTLLQEALTLNRRIEGPWSLPVQGSVEALGELRASQGRYEEADLLFREGLTIRRHRFGPEGLPVADGLSNVATLQLYRNDLAQADSLLREGLRIHELHGRRTSLAAATILNNLSILHYYQEAYPNAVTLLEEALTIRRDSLGAGHPDVLLTMQNLALMYQFVRNFDAADALFQEALSESRRVLGPQHPGVGLILNNLGLLRKEQGRFEEGEALLREALAMDEVLLGSGHPEVQSRRHNLGILCLDLDRYDEAERFLRAALAERTKALPPDHPDLLATRHYLAEVLLFGGRTPEARALLDPIPASAPSRQQGLANIMLGLAQLADDPQQAEAHARRGLEDLRASPRGIGWEEALGTVTLGRTLVRQGAYRSADSLLVAAYAMLEAESGTPPRYARLARQGLFELYTAWNRPAEAVRYRPD